uniref:C-type lectin domain-containing protein n=1 Tax=Tetradesmus obliquus TaxID=3088 RepID=A0A383VWP3_TETOB|eukprot:jgi/Sobl393_1/6037/SZX69631.1
MQTATACQEWVLADEVEELQELRQAIGLTAALLQEPLDVVRVGAQRAAGSSKWLWDTPAGLQDRNSLLLWNPGEPNGQPQERVCLQVTDVLSSMRNSVWMNDQGCEEKLPYACISNT